LTDDDLVRILFVPLRLPLRIVEMAVIFDCDLNNAQHP
jgi:hypothetical protein